MKKNYYNCDSGAIAILCGNSVIRINNNYGDGEFKFYILNQEEFIEYKEKHLQYGMKEYCFITRCEFSNAYVLNYDCIRSKNINSYNLIGKLDGEYMIYSYNGKIYFVEV